MSYEGYEQHICNNGHKYECDVYASDTNCYHCKAPSVFYNSVDDTNCDEWGIILEKDWEQFQLSPAQEVETCEHCGHTKVVEPALYSVPTEAELKTVRKYRKADFSPHERDVYLLCSEA